jgi:hypothetical protein
MQYVQMPSSPVDVHAPPSCICGYGECCVCPTTERALRAIKDSDVKMTAEQREWCLNELNKVEGYSREDHVNDFDRTLANAVLCSWVDYCRDKGLL